MFGRDFGLVFELNLFKILLHGNVLSWAHFEYSAFLGVEGKSLNFLIFLDDIIWVHNIKSGNGEGAWRERILSHIQLFLIDILVWESIVIVTFIRMALHG